MATKIYSSTPNVILEGIQDLSGRIVPPEAEAQPQHLPLFYTFAEKGSDAEPFVVTGTSLINTFGSQFLDLNSKFATHATPFIKGLNQEGNLIMLQRLRPTGAATAWLRFSLEVTVIPQLMETVRDVVSTVDKNGKTITKTVSVDKPVTYYPDGPEVGKGYQLRWIVTGGGATGADTDKFSAEDLSRYKDSLSFGKGLTVVDIGEVDDQTLNSLATSITTAGTTISRSYPILDLEVTDFGAYGNNLGVRLSAPNLKSNVRPDKRFFDQTLARPFRIEFIRRKNPRSPAVTINNNYGESSTDFVFKRGQVNPLQNNEDIYIGTFLLDYYRNLDTSFGRVPRYGPFNRIKVYDENIDHILRKLYQAEKEADAEMEKFLRNGSVKEVQSATTNAVFTDALVSNVGPNSLRLQTSTDAEINANEAHWQIDFLTGKSITGYRYRKIRIAELRNDGKLVDETAEYWARGGDDGLMSNREYNRLVAAHLQAFDDSSNPMLDLARYPFTCFYDTGYPQEVKQDMVTLIRARKDVSISLSTHYVVEEGDYRDPDDVLGVRVLKRSEEASMVRGLASWATAFPESEVYGTKACRANIIMQCGMIIASDWKGKVPMTYELAMKRARFMGSPDGKMRPGYGYDQDGVKQLQFVKEVNNPFVPLETREINWTHGATWAQYYDRNTMFFPAVRTVYKDETSVLLSDINMLIATDLEKVCFRTWRRLVGNTKLSNDQFIALSNQYILEDVEGRYDGRVVIRPETFYTPADELRGFSWSCRVHMYAPNMKTVGVMTVVTHRLSDLEG